VTLDGTRVVGKLTFNSPSSYTIAGGPGGSIVLDNTAGNASVSAHQGSHTISTGVQLQDSVDVSIDGGTLTIAGAISGDGAITKNGPGTLALTNGANSFTGITTINGGVITVTSDACLGQVPSITTSNAITFNGGTWRNVGGSAIAIPATRGITVLAGGGTLDFSSTAGVPALNAKITGAGTLTKMGIRTLGVASDSSATFSGNWLVKQGRLNVNAGGTVNALGTGTITLSPGSGDAAQLGIGLSTGGIVAELVNPIVVSPTGNGQVSFEVNAGNTLTLSGNISGAGGLQKSGGSGSGTQGGNPLVTTGTLILTGNNTYTGGTTVNAGMLAVKRLHENNAVNVAGGTLQVLQHAPGASVAASRPSSLSIANNGAPLGSRTYNATLDLANNDLVLDYAPGISAAASVEDMIRAGFHGGYWLGAGIVSSTAGANDWIYTLGVADNARLGLSSFGGHLGLNGNQVLVRYTIYGDADLSGSINAADFARFRAGFANEMPDSWLFGDFNYSGEVDAIDFELFLLGFHNQPDSTLTPQFAGEMITFAIANGLDYTLVPEPTGLAIFALLAACAGRRPRRSWSWAACHEAQTARLARPNGLR
jgi:autotransporter-associated beta strand protein